VKPLRKGRAQVQLSRETPQTEVVPLTERQRMQFLRSTPSVQSDDADILALARQIVGSQTDPVRMSGLIVDWIDRNLSKAHDSGASTATAVLAQRSGDCTEHALLFTALARAAGIPARQVGGIIYVEDPEPLFGWHAWAEIHDGRGWVTVDPTWRQVRVDPTHVQFTFPSEQSDEDDYGWVQVLGKLKIKVTKVEQSG
jgi:transglutaminase-like putative cysteine protease